MAAAALIHRVRRKNLLPDSLQAGGQTQGQSQIRIAGGVGASKLAEAEDRGKRLWYAYQYVFIPGGEEYFPGFRRSQWLEQGGVLFYRRYFEACQGNHSYYQSFSEFLQASVAADLLTQNLCHQLIRLHGIQGFQKIPRKGLDPSLLPLLIRHHASTAWAIARRDKTVTL